MNEYERTFILKNYLKTHMIDVHYVDIVRVGVTFFGEIMDAMQWRVTAGQFIPVNVQKRNAAVIEASPSDSGNATAVHEQVSGGFYVSMQSRYLF